MKLLVVASTFPSGDTDPVPAFVRDQLIRLKKHRPDLEISVLAPHDSRSNTQNFSRRAAYDEFRFHYFWPFAAEKLAGRGILPALKANPLCGFLIPFLFLGEFLALLTLTRKLKPDVIYAHWFTPQGVVSSWVSRITGTPFVFTTHASDVDVWRRIPLAGNFVVRRVTRCADAFTAVSRRSMGKLERFFSAGEWQDLGRNGAIIPMGVNLPRRSRAATEPPEATEPATEPHVVLFLGRLAEKKGLQYLLPAFAQVRSVMGDSVLIIAGDGPMRCQIERQTAELGISDCVRFAGFVTGEQKTDLLQRADLFVVPSIVTNDGDAEGLPVSLMEGLAWGRICIATKESGADDILTHGHDGFLIPGKDSVALSQALIDACILDTERRNAIEANARITAQQFDWETVARRHYDFLFRRYSGDDP